MPTPLTPEEILQAASKLWEKQRRNGHHATMLAAVMSGSTASTVDDKEVEEEGTKGSSLVPPTTLRRHNGVVHPVLPGAYRVHRHHIVAVLGGGHSHRHRNNGGTAVAAGTSCRRCADEEIGAVVVDDERTRSIEGEDYHHRDPNNHGSAETTGSSISAEHEEEDGDDLLQQSSRSDGSSNARRPSSSSNGSASSNSSSRRHHHGEHDNPNRQVVTLEAELVGTQYEYEYEENDPRHQQVIKAEPMHHRYMISMLMAFIAVLVLALTASLLVPRLLQTRDISTGPSSSPTPDTDFSYYTHHAVLFASTDVLEDVDVVLDCGNDGAVVVKTTEGPCDERNNDDGGRTLTCNLGNHVRAYDRHIFFSCGSHYLITAPRATVKASGVDGQGLLLLCLFQLCDDASVPQNASCGGGATLNHVPEQESNGDDRPQLFSLCSSPDIVAGVSVTNVGMTCLATTPFHQSPAQIDFANRKQKSILSWLGRTGG
jgi:hypothetical protein